MELILLPDRLAISRLPQNAPIPPWALAGDFYAVFRNEEGVGAGYFITSLIAQLVLGILASMIVAWFSRQREFRADAGGARLAG